MRCTWKKTALLGIAVMLMAGVFLPDALRASRRRMVVVLVTVSGLTYDAVVASQSQSMPQLRELMRTGALFTNVYAPADNAAASLASLLTGMSVPEHGVWEKGDVLLNSVPLLPDDWRRRGMPTAAFSNSPLPLTTSLTHGFAVAPPPAMDAAQVNGMVAAWLAEHPAGGTPPALWVHYRDVLTVSGGAEALRMTDYHIGKLLTVLRHAGYHQGNTMFLVAGVPGPAAGGAPADRLCREVVHVPLVWSVPGGRRQARPELRSLADVPALLRAELDGLPWPLPAAEVFATAGGARSGRLHLAAISPGRFAVDQAATELSPAGQAFHARQLARSPLLTAARRSETLRATGYLH